MASLTTMSFREIDGEFVQGHPFKLEDACGGKNPEVDENDRFSSTQSSASNWMFHLGSREKVREAAL